MGLQLCLFTASFKSAFAYTLFTDHKEKFLIPIISIHHSSSTKQAFSIGSLTQRYAGSLCVRSCQINVLVKPWILRGGSTRLRLFKWANVSFHYISSETQRLSTNHMAQSIQNSKTRSLWLCTSRSFTSSIAKNLKTRSLHQELFELR